MKFRNTLILLVIVGALLAYVGLVERDRKTTQEAADASSRVVEFDRDNINAVTIKNPEAKIEFRKQGLDWQLEADSIKDRADSMTLTQLFTTMETLKHDARIEPEKGKDELKEFGVADSDTKVTFSSEDQKKIELLIGKDAAVAGKVYARVEGDDTVFVIPNDLKNQITKKLDEYRERKLTNLTTQQVEKVIAKSAAGETLLEKKDGHWSITKPLQARGDDSRINDMVAQATTARIDRFINDSNLASFGLAEPRATITFETDEAGKPVVLQLGDSPKDEKEKEKEKEKDKVYAKLSTRDSVVLVPKDVEKLVTATPNDLRDRNLLRFESDIVDRITIEPAGKEKIVLARKGESWVRKAGDQDVAINATVPSRLLIDLKNTEVTNFVSDTAANLAQYGLEQPNLKVTLSSFASENTSETNAGAKDIVTLLIGTVEGDSGYAKVDSEPFIVAVPKTLIQSIPTSPIELQDLIIYDLDPEKITSLEITKKEQAPVGLVREKGEWKPAKGDAAVNKENVQLIVNTLAVLRAMRWAGPTDPEEHGLKEPLITVNFTTTDGDKKTEHKLLVGSATPADQWYATANQQTGTFMLSRPDHDNLVLPLLETASTPATSAAPDASAATVTPGTPAAPVAPGTPAAQPGAAPAATPAPVPVPQPEPAPEAEPAATPETPAPADADGASTAPDEEEDEATPGAPAEEAAAPQ